MAKTKVSKNIRTDVTETTRAVLEPVLRGIAIGILILDKRLHIRDFSEPVKRIFDINTESRGQLIINYGCVLSNGIPLEDIKTVRRKGLPIEKEVTTLQDETFIMNISPSLDENNKVWGITLSFVNITERKAEENKLLLNRNHIATALDATKAGWGSWDWRTGEGKWSIAGIRLMDFSLDEDFSTAKGWLQKIIPEDRENILQRIRETIKNKTDFYADYRILTRDKKIRYINATGKVTFDANGYAVSSTGLVIDRTEQKKAEANLGFLAEVSQDLISINSIEEMMQTVGEKISRFLSLSNCLFVKFNDTGKEAEVVYNSGKKQSQSANGTYLLAHYLSKEFLRLGRDGKNFVVNDVNKDKRVNNSAFSRHGICSYLAVPFVAEKQWQFCICVCHSEAHSWDKEEIKLVEELTSRTWTILEHKRAEAELRASEEKFRTIFSSIDEAFSICEMIYDEEGNPYDYRILEANPAFEKVTGLTAHFVIGRTAREVRPGIEDFWMATFDEVVKTRKPIRFQNKAIVANRWYDVYASPQGEPGSGRFALILNDITTSKQAELALQQSEERLRLTINAGNIGTADWNVKENVMVCNNIRFAMFGLEAYSNAVSTNEFRDRIHRDDAGALFKKIPSDIRNDGRYTAEYRIQLPDETVRWLLESGEVIEWDGKEPLRIISIVMDITDRKDEEKQKDDFFSVASHELKTPVTSIRAYSEILEELFKSAGDMHSADLMHRLNGQVDRLTTLINHMLDTTRLAEGQMQLNVEDIDIAELTKAAVEEMQRTTSRHQILTYTTKLPLIKGDKEKLGQVLTNFLSNAIKYSPKPTDIVVKALLVDNYIHVTVQDFGIGMSAGTLARLFQRFFRSDNPEVHTYPGLGLGLYISREIVKTHGGSIIVKSEKRKGSVFTMVLPVE